MTENNETTNFDELDHSDEWPDATVRETDMEPDEAGKAYLEELAAHLEEIYKQIEKEAGEAL